MRRALILITVMTLLGTSVGLWMESRLGDICADYVARAEDVRNLIQSGRMEEAAVEQACLFACWQGETRRLNAMVSHHHTRAVDEALLALSTALEEGWRLEALQALDAAQFALRDPESDMTLRWENVL